MSAADNKLKRNKAFKRIRKAAYAEKLTISSDKVKEMRNQYPGCSLQDALGQATYESGRVCEDSQLELIRALVHQVTILTEEVDALRNRKQTW